MQRESAYALGGIGLACYLLQRDRGRDEHEDKGPTRLSSTRASESDGEDLLGDELSSCAERLRAEGITLPQVASVLMGLAGEQTVMTVVEEFCALSRGGALVVVYDVKGGQELDVTLPIKSMGNGKLKDVMRHYAKSLFTGGTEDARVNPNFRAVLRGSCSASRDGPTAGEWTRQMLEVMAESLGQSWDTAHESLRQLVGEPADGALAIFSMRGTMVGACSRIDAGSDVELLRPDGSSTGMRHTVGASAVEWCRQNGLQGAAVIRSEAGHVTLVVIIGEHLQAFEIVDVESGT